MLLEESSDASGQDNLPGNCTELEKKIKKEIPSSYDVQDEKTVEWVCCDNKCCKQRSDTFCVRLNNRKWSKLQPFRCCNNRSKTGAIHRKFHDLSSVRNPSATEKVD